MTAALLLVLAAGPADTRVGSKKDTESALLGELAAGLMANAGRPVVHRRQLGGTPVLWQALVAGEIDVYPEFTGTLAFQILNDPTLTDVARLAPALDALPTRLAVTAPLGYANNYAIGVRGAVADRLGLKTVSDMARHPELRLRLTPEFVKRADGWPALKKAYALPHPDPDGTDHALAYQGVRAGTVDVLDVYTTEAEIDRFGVRVLADDRRFFPQYAAVYVYRRDWAAAHPAALASLGRLRLDEPTVRRLNGRILDGADAAVVAADFLRDEFGLTPTAAPESATTKLVRHTVEHLRLVAVALLAAVPVAVPLGVLAARRPRLGQVVIGVAGLVQTIPSLALLVLLVAVPPQYGGGLGWRPAVVALFLYALLPIIRNTATGLTDIPPHLRETAAAIGLTPWQSLRRVELPLAARSILGGIKTAAVITVGTATLGALIDAGGLGVLIQQGLTVLDRRLILLGAVPAAALALLVQGGFELLERWVVPRGLR